MPNEPGIWESPWLQLGVPIAAAGLSIADRTRHGRIAQGAQGVAQGVQGYGRQMQKERLSQIERDSEAEAESKFEQNYTNQGKAEDPTVDDGLAPEGGDVPATDMAARTASLEEHGEVAKPTFQFSPIQQQEIRTLHKGIGGAAGRAAASKRMAEFMGEYQKSQQPPPPRPSHFTNITNEFGDQVENETTGDGRQIQRYLGGSPPQKPDQSVSELELWQKDPAAYDRFNRAKQSANPQQPHWQVQTATDGTLYRVNPNTGQMLPFQAPPQASGQDRPLGQPTLEQFGPKQADFSGVSTGNEPALQQGTPTQVTPSQQPKAAQTGKPTFSRGSGATMTDDDVAAVGDAIMTGRRAPNTSGLYRNAGRVEAYIAKKGFNLAEAQLDFEATKSYLKSGNSRPALKMRQAINTSYHHIDVIEGLVREWHKKAPQWGFRGLNKAQLETVKQMPGEIGALAQALDTQINDLTSEIGVLYMGGNSPTDHGLEIAAKNLASNWNEETLNRSIPLLRRNIGLRANSIKSIGAFGVSENSRYGHQSTDESYDDGSEDLGQPIGAATGKPDGPAQLKDGRRVIIKGGLAYAAP